MKSNNYSNYNYDIRPLAKLATDEEFTEGTERKTAAYLDVCSDAVPAHKLSSVVGFSQRSIEIVANKLYEWINAVIARDLAKTISLYHNDATILPTFNSNLLRSIGEIMNYVKAFSSFTSLDIKIASLHTRIYDNIAINNGMYNISYKNDKGQIVEIPARFNFTYIFQDDGWLIIDQHSSPIPENIIPISK